MTVSAFSSHNVGTDDYYAREADRIARGPQLYGGNAAIVQLRCFKYYHPDQGSYMTDPWGKDRWLGPKASRIFAILHRVSSSGRGRTTMTAIASEAMASTSTVSRTVQRLQAFGFFAIDVTRGRNGGIVVRRRSVGDHLRYYAEAAWKRIRAWINVASTIPEREKGLTGNYLVVDATFTREAAIERLGARVLAGEIPVELLVERSRRLGAGDLDRQSGRLTAANVIAERIAMDRDDPDWDLLLEDARRRWLR